jgi:hypothetical protein
MYWQVTNMDSIDQHIQKDKSILDDPQTSSQSRRHIEEELAALQAYKKNHPDRHQDPTPLDLYCDAHPDAPECRIYDN